MRYAGLCAFGAILTIFLQPSCGKDGSNEGQLFEEWDRSNDPARFGMQPIHYNKVPPKGELQADRIPWSSYYWPVYKGGLAYRWHNGSSGGSYQDYLYTPYAPEDAYKLTTDQIRQLSPAEKFDLALGRVEFPLVKQQLASTKQSVRDGEVPEWYGNCHGWAAAAVQEPRPRHPVVRYSPNGQKIEFSPTDIAALVTGIYSRLNFTQVAIGVRCEEKDVERDPYGRTKSSSCRDVNPASLHLALHYYINMAKRSFVADFEQGHQVWNYPITGYQFSYTNLRPADHRDPHHSHRAPGTRYLVDTTLNLAYTSGSSGPALPPNNSTDLMSLRYTLELDAAQRIIGGEWQSQTHPDFLWDVRSTPRSVADEYNYEEVRALLTASVHGTTTPEAPDPQEEEQPEVEEEPVRGESAIDRAVLKLVNSNFADYLIHRVGLRASVAYKLRVHYLGPDGTSQTADDNPFTTIAELRQYLTTRDLEVLRRFVSL